MGPLDAIWHLANLFLPALLLGTVAAAATKLLWRRELGGQSCLQLMLPTCAAAALTTLAGLIIFGRDGRMATYAAMVVASALTLWWRGFWRPRR